MIQNNLSFLMLKPFYFNITYNDSPFENRAYENYHHTHNECEIYINVSGDISFMVEDKIYSISPGNVLISRPHENHHCIYNTPCRHKHYWILFSSSGNEMLFDLFFNRNPGEKNLIILSPENEVKLQNLCKMLLKKELSELEKYLYFFELISILQTGNHTHQKELSLPKPLIASLEKIHQNISHPINISSLAKELFVSVSTLERLFKTHLHTTPNAYILQKRLNYAEMLLMNGENVSRAGELSGFSDNSHFIATFKRHYGITPLSYKKKNNL